MLKQDRVDRKKQVNLARFEEILLFCNGSLICVLN